MGRRTKGTGTVYQIPSGKYVAQATIAGRRRSVTCEGKREAEKALRQMLGDADRGIVLSPEKLTVGQWLERWLSDVAPNKVRAESLKTYAVLVRVHIGPGLGHIRLSNLQRSHIRTFHSDLVAKGLRAGSVQKVHSVLSGCLQDALKDDLIGRNVARGVQLPTVRRREMRTLDPQQARSLLATSHGTRYEALLTLALYSGMRMGELLALRWQDVDLDRQLLRVSNSLSRSKTMNDPKTYASSRVLSLPSPCIEALKAHKVRQHEERQAAGDTWRDSGFVFCTGRVGRCKTTTTYPGSPLTARLVQRDVQLLMKRAGLPVVRFHDLRHTAATLMLLGGVSPKVASERLGHSRIGTTLDIYAHVLPAQDREAADRLGAMLG